jgi:hypothetical protein
MVFSYEVTRRVDISPRSGRIFDAFVDRLADMLSPFDPVAR